MDWKYDVDVQEKNTTFWIKIVSNLFSNFFVRKVSITVTSYVGFIYVSYQADDVPGPVPLQQAHGKKWSPYTSWLQSTFGQIVPAMVLKKIISFATWTSKSQGNIWNMQSLDFRDLGRLSMRLLESFEVLQPNLSMPTSRQQNQSHLEGPQWPKRSHKNQNFYIFLCLFSERAKRNYKLVVHLDKCS